LVATDLLGLQELQDFAITGLSLDPLSSGLGLRLAGEVGRILVKSGALTLDRSPTLLEAIRASSGLAFILTLVLGTASATWGTPTPPWATPGGPSRTTSRHWRFSAR
jgi:hypothetical protein